MSAKTILLSACVATAIAAPAAAADFNFRMTTFSGDTGIYYTCMAKPFTEKSDN